MTKLEVVDRIKKIMEIAHEKLGYNYKLHIKEWQNHGKNRTYYTVYETSDVSKHNIALDFGYYDNIAEKMVEGKCSINYYLRGSKIDD